VLVAKVPHNILAMSEEKRPSALSGIKIRVA
jgi:hypothetical protein